MKRDQPTIFDIGHAGRSAPAQMPGEGSLSGIPASLLRTTPPALPEVSELQAVRHYTNLSRRNFSIETQFYPARLVHHEVQPARHAPCGEPAGISRSPSARARVAQSGIPECLYELQEILKDVTGMRAVSLTPMAGAQGEFAVSR